MWLASSDFVPSPCVRLSARTQRLSHSRELVYRSG